MFCGWGGICDLGEAIGWVGGEREWLRRWGMGRLAGE